MEEIQDGVAHRRDFGQQQFGGIVAAVASHRVQ
jgi:hypothetical protein